MKISKIITIAFFGFMVVSSVKADLDDLNETFASVSFHVLESVCNRVGSGNYIRALDSEIVCEGVSDADCKNVANVSEKYGMKIKTEYTGGTCRIGFSKEQSKQ